MKDQNTTQPAVLFLINALLISFWTALAVRYDAIDDPEFLFLLILIWPVTLIAIGSVLVLSVKAISLSFNSDKKHPIMIALSYLTMTYLAFIVVSPTLGFVTGFTTIIVSILYAAISATAFGICFNFTNRGLQIAFILITVLIAIFYIVILNKQQEDDEFERWRRKIEQPVKEPLVIPR